jgi:protein gp37
MSDGTLIEWTDATWNVINGCSVVSPGCTNCYAMKLAGTRLRNHPSRQGLTKPSKAGPVWTGETRFNEPVLTDPLKWKRPRKIFVCAHGDLFHESVPFGWIDRVFAIMALASQHVFQVLTKRPDRMREYFTDPNTWGRIIAASDDLKPSTKWNGNAYQLRYEITTNGFLPNVWLGTSVEDQARADERVPHLLATPAAVRWISAEPLLGPVDFVHVKHDAIEGASIDCLRGLEWSPPDREFQVSVGMSPRNWTGKQGPSRIHWIVVGGESGDGARPMNRDWARRVRDHCLAAGVAFHFKQWGNWVPEDHLDSATAAATYQDDLKNKRTYRFTGEPMRRVDKKTAGRLLDGVQHDGYPA